MHTSRKLINNQDFGVMAVVRRGAAPPPSSSESSSDEEDAFTAISRGAKKKNKKKGLDSRGGGKSNGGGAVAPAAASVGAPADTSSNRRHHHVSSERQAKMEALLQELKEAEQELQKSGRSGDAVAGHYGPGSGDRPPLKRGSYCERGEEMLTTNIFVGNLHPATTEEELTEIFRQFGETILGLWQGASFCLRSCVQLVCLLSNNNI